MKIVFFGTPEFAVASLDRLVQGGKDIAAVVTMPDKIGGRGHKLMQSDVKKYALEHGLKVLQPANLKDESFIKELRELEADLFIVIAFRMLPEAVWGMPPLGTFNLHASLLPKYRGAAPINRAVMAGEKKTGVTTFFLKHEIDTGDIIMQREIEIGEDENVGSVHDRLMELGAAMVAETVEDIEKGKVVSNPQPEGEFIGAPKIFKDTCKIDWNQTAAKVHDHIRGLSPYPAALCNMLLPDGRTSEVKIMQSRRTDKSSLKPGEPKIDGKHLYVGTSDEDIEILALQPSGKKLMEANAFILGYHPAKFD